MRIAIIANRKARSVDQSAIDDILEAAADTAEVFVFDSTKNAEAIAHFVSASGFDVVMCAGGDGTFGQIVTQVLAAKPKKIPAFGVLRLGTGNGVADTLRVSAFNKENVKLELARARDPEARIGKTMLKIGERYAPFAGLGLDGYVLQDYHLVKKIFDHAPFLPNKGRGVMDYAIAIASRSFWRYAFSEQPIFIIRNNRGEARRMDFHGGHVGVPITPGEIIYKGPASFIGASTAPYYGFNIPFFPQVITLFNRFQLLVSAMEAHEALMQFPDILNGRLSHPKVWNFACKEITIEISDEPKNKKYRRGVPGQIGGDFAGKLKSITIGVEKIQAVSGSASAAPPPPTR